MSTDSQLAGGRAPAPRTTPRRSVAETIVIDHVDGRVIIDGVELPWYLAQQGPEVENLENLISIVHLPVYADNVFVLHTLEHDLEEIRALGAKELSEAVATFKAKAEGVRMKAANAAQMRRREIARFPNRVKMRGVAALLTAAADDDAPWRR